MNRRYAIVAILAVSLGRPLRSDTVPAATGIPASGSTRLASPGSHPRARVTITTRQGDFWDFITEEKFHSRVEKLCICVDKKQVFVPTEAYAHLFDPHHASLIWKGRLGALTMEGSDAAYYWMSRLEFDAHSVVRTTSRDEVGTIVEATYRVTLPVFDDEPGQPPCDDTEPNK